MAKLTVTQIDLLKEAARNPDGIAGFQHGCWSGGRKGAFGGRKLDAMKALIKAGLAIHRDTHRSIIYGRWNCATCHSADISFYITDAGRAAVTFL